MSSDNLNNSDDYDNTNDDKVIVCPDLLLEKIKKCYQLLEENKELIGLENKFDEVENEVVTEVVTEVERSVNDSVSIPILTPHTTHTLPHNTPHTVPHTTHSTTHNTSTSLPQLASDSYSLLESRVVGAVSGEQVAFGRVRHAKQDAMIVRYVHNPYLLRNLYCRKLSMTMRFEKRVAIFFLFVFIFFFITPFILY